MQQQKPLEGAQLVIMTIALSLATFMQVLDSTIANVAIPTIAGNLGSSLSQGTWVITSFGVANAISIPLTGWLAKRVGEVKLFLWSTIAFAIASWACGVSSSLNMLIFFRVIQGIVAGPLIPLSQSLLLNNYPPAKRSIALALWSMTVIVAPICGPILGGYISDNFGKKYLPESPNQYASKENSQEAHEAIRPSDVNVMAESLKDMEADAQKLYQLIWRQFVACQMTPAKYDSTTLTVGAGDFRLKARGRILRFDGWTKVMPALRKGDEDRILPAVNKGDALTLVELTPAQHFTKPPARFSEASLVKELEKRGIGRPSTYASIISTIQDRGYVRVENRRFYAEKMGEIVTDRLEENFRELMNYDFTAQMENSLDQVANHEAEWKAVLDHFFSDFTQQLDKAEKDPEEGGMRPNQMVLTSIDCPTCGRKMGIRTASTGVFLGCSGYALPPKERCKTTINLVPENEVLNVLEGEDAETNALRAKRRCPKCGTAMDSYLIDPKRKLHVCGNNPTCDGYEIEEGEFRIKGYDGPIVECEKCGSEMHLKMGRFGKYMACTNEECKNTRKILRNGEVAPPKEDPVPLPELPCEKSDAYFVLRDGAAGVFLAANTFPKSRETRAPLVEELYRFRDRLPEKLRYLADAPQQDPEGNKTMVRFSRKTKQQYVSSEKDGKATGWSAFYVDGKWVEGKK
ncbi:DHA2 family efflux MFS transporter permease subunit [Escherichia coli]